MQEPTPFFFKRTHLYALQNEIPQYLNFWGSQKSWFLSEKTVALR